MRCKKLIAVLLAAIYLLGVVAPALAGDGTKPRLFDMRLKDHPWQDENAKGGDWKVKTPVGFVIGSILITVDIVIPFIEKPVKTTSSSGKLETQKVVEKRK
jgi:hypothetical protein